MPEVDVEKWIRRIEAQAEDNKQQVEDLKQRVEILEGYHGKDGAWSAVPPVEG